MATATPAADERVAPTGALGRVLKRPEVGALVAAVVVFVFFAVQTDVFATPSGASTWLRSASTIGIMAVGVALLMIGGEFDLSAGAMTGFTGLAVGVMTTQYGLNIWVAMLVSLAMALSFGLVNGLLVMRTGLPSFIVTLGTFFVLQGIDLALVKALIGQVAIQGMRQVPFYDQPHALFGSYITINGGRVYASVFWWIAVTVVATWVLMRTRAGNWIFAVGGAQQSSRQVGVPVAATKIGAVHDHRRRRLAGRHAAAVHHLHGPEQHRRRPGVHLHHLCGRRRLPADRWLRLRDRGGPRSADLRHGQPGHRLRRVGQQLAQGLPRSHAAGSGAAQRMGPQAGGDDTMTTTHEKLPKHGRGGMLRKSKTGRVDGVDLTPPAAGTPIIEVKDIGKRYGYVIALSDVTTSVRAGEVTCVLGDNGAGKSTLIKILAGAHEHSDGQLLIDGVARHLSSPR